MHVKPTDIPNGRQDDLASDRSYGQILKSSAIIGGSSVITIAMGIVRTKVIALLLGPAGVGLTGLYGSILEIAHSLAGMGINSSGVRQIADSTASGNSERIARTVVTLRRVALALGILGAVMLFFLSTPVSKLTFGDTKYAGSISLLSLAVLFGAISSAQTALVQGMRRIADLARLNIIGAFLTTVCSLAVGIIITAGAGIYSLKTLRTLVGSNRLPKFVQKLFRLLRI